MLTNEEISEMTIVRLYDSDSVEWSEGQECYYCSWWIDEIMFHFLSKDKERLSDKNCRKIILEEVLKQYQLFEIDEMTKDRCKRLDICWDDYIPPMCQAVFGAAAFVLDSPSEKI